MHEFLCNQKLKILLKIRRYTFGFVENLSTYNLSMKTETEFSFQTRAFCQDSYSRNSIKASFTLSNFVGDCVFLKDANELAHESGIESLFRSKQFEVFCMSFIRSHFPGGEKSPTELPV